MQSSLIYTVSILAIILMAYVVKRTQYISNLSVTNSPPEPNTPEQSKPSGTNPTSTPSPTSLPTPSPTSTSTSTPSPPSTDTYSALQYRWRMTDIYDTTTTTIITNTTESYAVEFYPSKRRRWLRNRVMTRHECTNAESLVVSGVDACNHYHGTCTIDESGHGSGNITFSPLAKTKKACLSQTKQFDQHSLTTMLSHVKRYMVIAPTPSLLDTPTTLELYTDNTVDNHLDRSTARNKYIFHKEIKGTIIATTIPDNSGFVIELYPRDTLKPTTVTLQVPALHDELKANYHQYHRTVYLTNIQPDTAMVSIYPGRLVTVDTVRFELSMMFGRPLRDSAARPILPDIIQPSAINWTYPLSLEVLEEIKTVKDKQAFVGPWCHAAQHECSSIESFERVIKELEHYCAPERGVINAHKARVDEINHTKLALSFANAASSATLYIANQWGLSDYIRHIDQFLRDDFNDACIGALERLMRRSN